MSNYAYPDSDMRWWIQTVTASLRRGESRVAVAAYLHKHAARRLQQRLDNVLENAAFVVRVEPHYEARKRYRVIIAWR